MQDRRCKPGSYVMRKSLTSSLAQFFDLALVWSHSLLAQCSGGSEIELS